MKQLKFTEPLPNLVLGGQKDTTWRINDDKEISTGDQLSLCCNDEREFTKAEVIWIKETTFENLTNEDKEGHEKFSSDEEMLQTYSGYYNIKIEPKTKVKVIKFKLL
ncbi:MAG: ASCH domain-containing protein [Patescibacteria group bacterium]